MSKKAKPTMKKEGSTGKFTLGTIQVDEELFQRIISNSHDAIMIMNENLEIDYISDEGFRIFGGNPKEIIGHHVGEYMDPDEAAMIFERFRKRVSGVKVPDVYQIGICRKDGQKRLVDIRITPIRHNSGKMNSLVHLQDRTEEIESREALRESEERYRTLIESMNDGLAIDEEDCILTYANKAFCNMLEYELDELIGKCWIDFTRDQDHDFVKGKIEERMSGASDRYEMHWITKSGRIVPTVVSAAPIFDSDSKFVGTFAVVTEITIQKEAEDTVQFYLDLLTHDISNQLQVIMTSAGLLDSELPKSYLEDAQTDIQDAVERCNRLITKVKRAGQLRYLPRTSMDLSTVVKEKVAVLERVYGAETTVKGLNGPSLVWADALLGELVWNLFENAARHNPVEEKKVWVTRKKKNGFIILEISDNGPGISKTRKKTLFESSKRHGGVGLQLVSQMARKYGGTLEVEDRVKGKPNLGAKFILSLKESR
jgi:PAS domain S-box-containing protein